MRAASQGGVVLALGDFNQDGKNDLAVADATGDTVGIVLNGY